MKRAFRILIGLIIGVAVVAGVILVLIRTLEDHESLYQGKPLNYWAAQLTNPEPTIARQANLALTNVIIPQLIRQILSDTNDSKLRLTLIDQLNGLPGVHINFAPTEGRRAGAIADLGSLGPRAKAAAPTLLEILTRNDDLLCGPAADALVKLQVDPETVVPALLGCVLDPAGHGRPDVVEALGEFGPQAKAAVPVLIGLLADRSSKEIMTAVPNALKKIDPEAAATAGVK